MTHPLIEALHGGRRQLGLWLTIEDPLVAEMLSALGYDWLLIDCEHTPMGPREALRLMQAAARGRSEVVVRTSQLDEAEFKKFLDIGATALMVPDVRTPEAATRAARAVEYGPAGLRGMAGPSRASGFGAAPDYARTARDGLALILQVESVEALSNLEAIAAVPGVDALFVGPADLAASMGFPGEPSHPEVVAASIDAIVRIRRSGLPAGFLTPDPDVLDRALDAGCDLVAVAIDSVLLRDGAAAALAHRR